nr:HAD hydrolase family protein [Desulfobacula sp.]
MTDAKTISSRDLSTLERLQAHGIITAAATGRSAHSLEKALTAIGLGRGQGIFPMDYVLFSTGAGIMAFPDREIIFQKSLAVPGVEKITAYFDQIKLDYMVHKAIPHTREFFYRSHGLSNPDFETRLAFHSGDGSPLNDRVSEPATQVLAIIPAGADGPDVGTIQENLPDFSVIRATSPLDHTSVWIEVFHKDVSKSKTAAFLAGRLSIHRRDSISIGNDYNDEDLLAWSGKGYVVENAPERLRRAYETVRSNNDSGVTMAAEKSGWMKNGD